MLRDEVHNALRDTVHDLLGKFCSNPTEFLAKMLAENAIVSGSAALHVLLATHFSVAGRSRYRWKPNDLDVYVPLTPHPHRSPPPFATYLIEHHDYNLRVQLQHMDLNYPLSEIHEIYHLFKGDKKIDIIVSKTQSSMRPIFKFHSTPVMNCITGSGIFSAYPGRTCNGQGLTNPMAIMENAYLPDLPSKSIRLALKKYRDRGFDIRLNPSCWPGDDHVCGRDPSCPHAIRSITDPGCLFLQLRSTGVDTVKKVLPNNPVITTDVGAAPCDIVWHLGGNDCKGRRSRMYGFIDGRPQRGYSVDMAVTG